MDVWHDDFCWKACCKTSNGCQTTVPLLWLSKCSLKVQIEEGGNRSFEMTHHILIPFLALFALTCTLALASHPSTLQDFCVAKPNCQVHVKGLACEDPKLARAEDFFGRLHRRFGSAATPVFVAQLPGLNTLGISMVPIGYAPWGAIPPHTHPRATKIITIPDGAMDVGFFPQGLIHFQRNISHANAVTISALSSQNPGVITIANAVFGSNGPIRRDVLTKAFHVEKKLVDSLQSPQF